MSTKATPPPTPAGIILQNGSKGGNVTLLETWLYQSKRGAFYVACGYDQSFGPMALHALEQWQKAAVQPVTGKITIGSTEWQLLKSEATANRLPAGISAASVQKAKTAGLAIDASKSPACVRVLQRDASAPQGIKVVVSINATYAGRALGNDGKYHNYTTPNGTFSIGWDDPDGVNAYSHNYFHAPMPWAACFIGHDVCFHYDGPAPSHGCVHIPSMDVAHYLYGLPIGTPVIVHA